MSDPFWLLRPPYCFITVGIFILLLALVYTYTGKAYIRFQGWVNRAEQPKRYWAEVTTYYFLGFGFIALFLYEVHWFSN
jgi:hypothetical protein